MARKWTLLTWVQNTITGSFHSVVFNSFLQLYLSFAALLTAECVCRCMCVSDRSLVFAEVTMLSNHISDYPLISQGQTRIPGVNDSEELILTVVSQTAHEAAPVFRHWDIKQIWHAHARPRNVQSLLHSLAIHLTPTQVTLRATRQGRLGIIEQRRALRSKYFTDDSVLSYRKMYFVQRHLRLL